MNEDMSKKELPDEMLEKVSAGTEQNNPDPNKSIPDNDTNKKRLNPQL